MLRQVKEKSFVLLGSSGPLLLLATFIVFSVHVSVTAITPYCWIGFVTSCALGLFVTILSMLEIETLFLEKKEQMQACKEELSHLQGALRAAQVSKLEEKEALQNEIEQIKQSGAKELEAVRDAYEKLHEEKGEEELPLKIVEEDNSAVFEHIQHMDAELVVLEQEVVVLHEIISKVLTEKKVVRTKKAKKIDSPSLLDELLDYKE